MSVVSCSTTSTTAYKVTADTTGKLDFQTGSTPTTYMTLDASGNLGVGTTSPTKKLEVVSGTGSYTDIALFRTAESTATSNVGGGFSGTPSATAGSRQVYMWLDADGANFSGSDYFYITKKGNSGDVDLVQVSSAAMTFSTSGTERARIDSSGNLLIGATSVPSAGSGGSAFYVDSNGRRALVMSTSTTSGNTLVSFANPNGYVGNITTSGSSTTYATSSDYRLKNTIAPMTEALARVAALKPVTYKWNADGSDGEGFIAHELAEVCPHAVVGEKDAVDADGNPVYQAIDTSFLVATLTAAIQELKAELDTAKAEIATLKGAA